MSFSMIYILLSIGVPALTFAACIGVQKALQHH